jgi:hypothetical protein
VPRRTPRSTKCRIISSARKGFSAARSATRCCPHGVEPVQTAEIGARELRHTPGVAV